MPMFDKKNAEIPTLLNYDQPAKESFWAFFPKRELPVKPKSRVNFRNLRHLVRKCKNKMTKFEIRRAEKVISDLSTGASSYQISDLPPIMAPNSSSCFEHGELLTDKIATWVKEGFVSGPFESPPMPGFRSNPLIAVARNRKIRPVVNMSGPKGASFNDNLDRPKLEKVKMTTAKQFGFSLREAGVRAVFSKFDIKDAYKLIPVKIGDLRLQGFYWLGKYFVETQETFGGVPSVCNFDRLGSTVTTLVVVLSEIPREAVSRTLDDFQCLGPEFGGIAEKFTRVMKEVCGFLNIPLAENCARNEKAFELQTKGTVLGINFDSTDLSWSISNEKGEKIVRRCMEAFHASHLNLQQTQKLMGSINDLAQMNHFLKFYKGTGNNLLGKFSNNSSLLLMVPDEMKRDLLVIAKSALTAIKGLPIPARGCLPPLSTLTFYSDAAGAKYNFQNGVFCLDHEPSRGVCVIGGESPMDTWIWSKLTWPKSFLLSKDSRGKEFGRKSTTLEALGLLLPLLAFPEKVAGKNMLLWVDNAAVCFGWEKGYVKFDREATAILQWANVLASLMGTTIYVKHIKRMSNNMAKLADEMSRKNYTSSGTNLGEHNFREYTGSLQKWLDNPIGHHDLEKQLVIKTLGQLDL